MISTRQARAIRDEILLALASPPAGVPVFPDAAVIWGPSDPPANASPWVLLTEIGGVAQGLDGEERHRPDPEDASQLLSITRETFEVTVQITVHVRRSAVTPTHEQSASAVLRRVFPRLARAESGGRLAAAGIGIRRRGAIIPTTGLLRGAQWETAATLSLVLVVAAIDTVAVQHIASAEGEGSILLPGPGPATVVPWSTE